MRIESIVLADDHHLIIKGLISELEKEEIAKIHTFNDGKIALEHIRYYRPQIAILDISMPGATGIDIAAEAQLKKWPTKIILLTMFHDLTYIEKAKQLGVKGYLLKDFVLEDIHECLETVLAGDVFFDRALAQCGAEIIDDLLSKLSRMEKKVFTLIEEGNSTKEIATLLFLSEKTIENHRYHISKKLELDGALSLTKFIMMRKGK